jgi:hypothetical protein
LRILDNAYNTYIKVFLTMHCMAHEGRLIMDEGDLEEHELAEHELLLGSTRRGITIVGKIHSLISEDHPA